MWGKTNRIFLNPQLVKQIIHLENVLENLLFFHFQIFFHKIFFFSLENTQIQMHRMGMKKNTNVRNPPNKKFQLNSENENFQSKQDINFVFMFQYSDFVHVYKWKMERICQILASWGYKFTFYFFLFFILLHLVHTHEREKGRINEWNQIKGLCINKDYKFLIYFANTRAALKINLSVFLFVSGMLEGIVLLLYLDYYNQNLFRLIL